MDLEEEREKVGRESGQGRLAGAPCGWWAGVCTGEAGGWDRGRAASSQHACGCAGPGSPAVARLRG